MHTKRLRIGLFIFTAVATLLVILSYVPIIRHWNDPHADGLQIVPAFFATPIYVVLVLPAFGLAIWGRPLALKIGAGLAALAAAAALIIFQ